MLMTLKAMTIIILTKVPLLTTSPQSRSCQLPHWRQWWRGNSTGCLSSGSAWEGRLTITISKTCLTKSFCFQQTSPKRDLQQIQNAEKATSWKMFHMTNYEIILSGTVKHDGALFVPFAKPLLQVFFWSYWDLTCCALVLEWGWPAYDCCHQGQ